MQPQPRAPQDVPTSLQPRKWVSTPCHESKELGISLIRYETTSPAAAAAVVVVVEVEAEEVAMVAESKMLLGRPREVAGAMRQIWPHRHRHSRRHSEAPLLLHVAIPAVQSIALHICAVAAARLPVQLHAVRQALRPYVRLRCRPRGAPLRKVWCQTISFRGRLTTSNISSTSSRSGVP